MDKRIGLKRKRHKISKDECVSNALAQNHRFLYKRGCMAWNDYDSRLSPLEFFPEFLSMTPTPEAYEMLLPLQDQMVYIDIEHTEFDHEPTPVEKMSVCSRTREVLKKLVNLPICFLTWESTRRLKPPLIKEESNSRSSTKTNNSSTSEKTRWKLSFHIILQTLKTKSTAQTENFILDFIDLASNQCWSNHIFYMTTDKNQKEIKKCIYDANVYHDNQLFRLPGSYKTKYNYKTRQRTVDATPFVFFRTPFQPKGLMGTLNEKTFLYSSVMYTENREGCPPAVFLSEEKFPLTRRNLKDFKAGSTDTSQRKYYKVIPRNVNFHGTRDSLETQDLLYTILLKEMKDASSTLHFQKSGSYRLHNQGGRHCAWNEYHDNNGAYFQIRGNTAYYYCLSDKCKSKGPKEFEITQLQKVPPRLSCISRTQNCRSITVI